MASAPRVGLVLSVFALHFSVGHATDLCMSVHAWVLHEHECPMPRWEGVPVKNGKVTYRMENGTTMTKKVDTDRKKIVIRHDVDQKQHDELGCGLGKTVYKELRHDAWHVSEGRQAAFGQDGEVYRDFMLEALCHPRYRVPIPDSCGRGIVADLQELYATQHVKWALKFTALTNLGGMSAHCSESREHYLAKLEKSSKRRNDWGFVLDFKAMYCVFYGGIELHEARQERGNESPEQGILCTSADCCAEARQKARAHLAPLLRGQTMPVGIVMAEVDVDGEVVMAAVAGGRGQRPAHTTANGRTSRASPDLDIDA